MPSSSAVSGITLDVVPAVIRPTVSTAGSNTLNRLVTIVCSAPTIAAAAGTGSIAWNGIAPCPPRPVTVTVHASALAMIGPGLQVTTPDVAVAVMCSASARSTGRPPASSTPSSIMCRAPWWPSSPGWNMKITRPDSASRRECSSRAAEASIAVCVSCPQACIVPRLLGREREPAVLGHRQRVHVPAQQHARPRLRRR